MFRLIINETDHGTFATVNSALAYIKGEIEDGELETLEASSLSIQIIK